MKNKIDIEHGRYWDEPWSLVSGCTPCSSGCDHCWSAAMTHRFGQNDRGFTDVRGKFNGHIVCHEERLSIPLKRRKPTVFAVWNDLFHEDAPDEFRDEVYDVMNQADNHTYLILTKRPHEMERYISNWCDAVGGYDVSRGHIWHGLTVCNQEEADAKIPEFLKVPGKKFLSIEPMLSRIETPFLSFHLDEYGNYREGGVIDAVIVGGETGPGARPMHPDWVRSVRDQCAASNTPFCFKQWGEWVPSCDYYEEDDELRDQCLGFPHIIFTRSGHAWNLNDGQPPVGSWILHKIGRKHHARLLDGRTHDDLPWVAK